MSARVTIDGSAEMLWVELKQNAAEVVRFAAFVLVVVGGVYSTTAAARYAPGALLAVIGVAAGWSIVALAGREVYTVDAATGVIDVSATSPLGRYRHQIATHEVGLVRMVTGGPDEDRRLVELVAPNGDLCLRVPRRLSTLSASDQLRVAQAFAERLEIPLSGTRESL